MKVVYIGGKQAGCVGLLTVLSLGYRVKGVVSYDSLLTNLSSLYNLPVYTSIKYEEVARLLSESDLLVSVHGREIVPQELLDLPYIGCINAHPCLAMYKGAHPVQRLLEDKGRLASVGVHRMTAEVDCGEVLSEIFVDVTGKKSVEEIYNALYPYYSMALVEALEKV